MLFQEINVFARRGLSALVAEPVKTVVEAYTKTCAKSELWTKIACWHGSSKKNKNDFKNKACASLS